MTVPLSTIKAALKIDYSDDDTELVRLRESAWSFIERSTQLVLSPTAQTLYLTKWEDILLPVHPFRSVTSVQYTYDGNVLVLSASSWWIDRTDMMPVLKWIDKPQIDPNTAITVTYSAGFDQLPGELTHCIIALVGAWYSNPEALQPVAMQQVPMSVQWILDTMSVRSAMR